MTTEEVARELGHPGAQNLLSGSMARLAYNGHDGFPRVVPVGFYWTGERIVVSTASTAPKARALASRPQVALTIDGGSTPEEAKALLVRGLATLETVDGVTEEYLASAGYRNFSPPSAASQRAFGSDKRPNLPEPRGGAAQGGVPRYTAGCLGRRSGKRTGCRAGIRHLTRYG